MEKNDSMWGSGRAGSGKKNEQRAQYHRVLIKMSDDGKVKGKEVRSQEKLKGTWEAGEAAWRWEISASIDFQ